MRVPRIAGIIMVLASLGSLGLVYTAFSFTSDFMVLWMAVGAMLFAAWITAGMLLQTDADNGLLTASAVVAMLATFVVPLFFVIRWTSPDAGQMLAIWSVFIETLILMIVLWGVAFAGGYLTEDTPGSDTAEPRKQAEPGAEEEKSEYVLPGGEL